MTACFVTLGDDRIAAVAFSQRASSALVAERARGTRGFHAIEQGRVGQAEVKTGDLGLEVLDDIAQGRRRTARD